MKRLLPAIALASACAGAPPVQAGALPAAAPAALGMSAERLQRADSLLASAIERQEYLGAVALVLRKGRVVDYKAFGHRDLARNEPLQRDAIFRILFDVQDRHRRRHPDPDGRGQAAAGRSRVEVHPRICRAAPLRWRHGGGA
ncbi:hypothetical protein ACHMW6_32285 [Pseudoduganella sp. UC29_106]|uniref:hypothetical protein n=1 Tax=Pseudoduganella sp. UC29_106 TaxID=3374553 RepID=UPI003756F79E